MYINQVFELSIILDNEKFHKILAKVHKRIAYLEENENEYIYHSMAAKGIMVKYRDSQYRKKAIVIANSKPILGSDKTNSDQLIQKLIKRMNEYFGSRFQMDDLILSGMRLITNIDVVDHKNVLAYLKALQRIGRVKGYSPTSYECFDDNASFCLNGNSNDIEFLIYDLEGAITKQFGKYNISKKSFKAMIWESRRIF